MLPVIAGSGSLQGKDQLNHVLDVSDTLGIEEAARAFCTTPPAPIATACSSMLRTPLLCGYGEPSRLKHQGNNSSDCSTFFHISLTVTAKQPQQAPADWTQLIEGSVARYVNRHCKEAVLVRADHTNTLRLEVALQFDDVHAGTNLRHHLRTRTIRNCLPIPSENWELATRILGSDADRRHASYEMLRARTLDPSRGGWRMVLDYALQKRLCTA
jgi:hypothetical protein